MFLFVFLYLLFTSTDAQTLEDGVPCEDNLDCVEFNANATCVDLFCLCPKGLCEDNFKEFVVNRLGENCRTSKNCNINNSICKNGKCQCEKNYTGSLNGIKCLKKSSLGDFCDESVQCYSQTPLAGCQENKCVCQQQMHEYKGSCVRDVDLNGFCSQDSECIREHSKCIKNKCKCIQNYISNTTACVPIAEGLGSRCTYNIQCQGKLGKVSTCTENICQCEKPFYYKEKMKKCVEDPLLNEICSNDSDCHQSGGDGQSRLECLADKCKCKSFYTEEDGYCISSAGIIKLAPMYLMQLILYLLLR